MAFHFVNCTSSQEPGAESLTPEFLARREDILRTVCDRVFNGSTKPLPEFDSWEGIYRRIPTENLNQHLIQLEANLTASIERLRVKNIGRSRRKVAA
jgi:hypothetical protein